MGRRGAGAFENREPRGLTAGARGPRGRGMDEQLALLHKASVPSTELTRVEFASVRSPVSLARSTGPPCCHDLGTTWVGW